MTKKVPPGGQKMNLDKNRLRHVDQCAMPIGKMVSLFILPIGNPKSAKGGHPYLRKLFPFLIFLKVSYSQNLILILDIDLKTILFWSNCFYVQ